MEDHWPGPKRHWPEWPHIAATRDIPDKPKDCIHHQVCSDMSPEMYPLARKFLQLGVGKMLHTKSLIVIMITPNRKLDDDFALFAKTCHVKK